MALSNRPSPGKLTPPVNLELSSEFHPTHGQRPPSAGQKEAKTLDFLSLSSSNDKYNNNSSRGSTVKEKDITILQMEPRPPPISSMATQDLFHLPEKGNPISKVVPPHHGLVPRAVPSSYPGNNSALVNGMLGLPPNVTFHMEGSEKSSGSKEHLENLVYWPAVQLKAGAPDLRHNSHLKPMPTLNNQWQQMGPDYVDTGKKSTTQVQSEEEDDDEEEFSHHNSDHNKELTLHKSDPPQKLDGKFHDAKGSTPRSKHSATEQRRRSKINNRFQMLRQLVPNHDQKRDKASFLLEVIEYIQLLQQKAIKYERSNRRQEPQRESELTLQKECGKEGMSSVSTSVPIDSKDASSLLRSRTNSATPPSNHEVGQASLCQDQSSHSSLQGNPYAFTNPTPMPYSQPLSPHIALFGRNAPSYSTMLAVSEPNTAPTNFNVESTSAPKMNDGANMWREEAHRGPLESGSEEPRFSQHCAISNEKQVGRPLGASATTRHMPNGKQGYMNGCSKVESQHKGDSKLNDQETMTIHGGLINVSSPYSEGLLNALAHALQISGLDLSKASISVQIDMGEGGISIASSSMKEPSGPPRKFRAPPELANDHLAKKTKIELEG